MQPIVDVRVQAQDFSQDDVLYNLRGVSKGIGAVCCFTGLARDLSNGAQVQTVTLEHYPGMTEKSIARIVEQALARWPVMAVTVIHRVGILRPSEQIVLVAVASSHRHAAFAACEFIMDFLKNRAPFWKKERTPTGEQWVETRSSDEEALRRW